jgi:predicted SnoaL-like aldol condensation-catalyzing enzyme
VPGQSTPATIIFNLLRIQDGLIAEHWDGGTGGIPVGGSGGGAKK